MTKYKKRKISKRERLCYIALSIWAMMGIIGMAYAVDLGQLALYFGAGAIPIIGYMFNESWRPSGYHTVEHKQDDIIPDDEIPTEETS